MTIKQTAIGYRMTADDLATLGMALGQLRQAEAVLEGLLEGTGMLEALERATFTDAELAKLALAQVGGDSRGDVIG